MRRRALGLCTHLVAASPRAMPKRYAGFAKRLREEMEEDKLLAGAYEYGRGVPKDTRTALAGIKKQPSKVIAQPKKH